MELAQVAPVPQRKQISASAFPARGSDHIPIVVNPYRTVVTAFFLNPQFSGLYGSSGPSKSTIYSGLVFVCDSGCVNFAVWPGSRLRIRDTTDCARCSKTDSPDAAVLCFSSLFGASSMVSPCDPDSMSSVELREECSCSSSRSVCAMVWCHVGMRRVCVVGMGDKGIWRKKISKASASSGRAC